MIPIKRSSFTLFVATLLTLIAVTPTASAVVFLNPGFTDPNSDYDGWEGFNSANYPGYGGYPGTAPWPAPIGSDTAGSGDATLNKVSGSGYPSTSPGVYYIYSTTVGGGNAIPELVVGSFAITDLNPVADLSTVTFQIQISYWDLVGTPFPTGVLPTLSYNNGAQNLAATYSSLNYTGAFTSDFGNGVADFWGFQWDLSEITTPIDSFSINYSVTNHAQTYALRLDQTAEMFDHSVVPEPSRAVLVMAALGALVFRRKRSA